MGTFIFWSISSPSRRFIPQKSPHKSGLVLPREAKPLLRTVLGAENSFRASRHSILIFSAVTSFGLNASSP